MLFIFLRNYKSGQKLNFPLKFPQVRLDRVLYQMAFWPLLVFYPLTSEAKLVEKPLPPFLFLELYQTYTLKAFPQDTLFIQNRILKAQAHPQGFTLKGFKVGDTKIHIKNEVIPTFVMDSFSFSKVQTLQTFLASHPTLKILAVPSGVLIKGEILSLTDFKFLIDHLPFSFQGIQYDFQFSDFIKDQGLQWLSHELNTYVSDIEASLGLQLNESPSPPLQSFLKKKGFKFSVKPLTTSIGMLKIAFLALNKTQIKKLDSLLPSHVHWTLKEKIQFLSQTYSFESLTSTSRSQKSSHLSILLFDKKKSTLHSGGEFAIRQTDFHRNQLDWKRYGLFLEVLPYSISSTKIRIELDLKLSLRQGDHQSPELSQDQLKQEIIIEKNRPYILTNVFTQILNSKRAGFLLFEQVPILRSLFRSKVHSKSKSEIFVLIEFDKETN